MQRFVGIIFCLFSLAGSKALAQGGSNYTLFGIGDVRRSVSSAYDGMAGTQIAVTSPYSVNLLNPAAWSALQSTRMQVGFRFNQQTVSNGNVSADQNNGKLDGFCLAFSIDTAKGIGAVLGLYPYSSINYSLSSPFTDSLLGKRIDGMVESAGSGGLTAAFLGCAVRPYDNLRIGASIIGLFGSIITTSQTTIFDANAYRSINQRNDALKGIGGRFGMMYSPVENFTVGISAATYANLHINSQLRQSTVSANEITSDSLMTTELQTAMPSSVGAGVSFLSGKFLYAADVEMQDFSSMTYRKGDASFRQNLRISGSVSRLATHNPGSPFESRVGFNLGVGYQQLYYSVMGTDINEMYGSFGMQIPVSYSAMLDVALTGGSRGVASNGALRELFMRFGFSASIGEIWFQPFARE